MTIEESRRTDLVTRALERYEAPLVRYAVSILGDLESARDVVQDTFLRLWKEEPGRVEAYLARWLFTVCRNRAFDIRRKEGPMRPLADVDLDRKPNRPRALDQLEQQEKLAEVLGAIDALPEREREVLTLKFHCDLSYREISEITHLTVNHVGVLIHNGVRRVRQKLQKTTATPSLARRLS